MITRVATSTLYTQGVSSMNNQQSSLLHVQQQLGTGRRVLNPSDDPVAATRILGIKQATSVNAQYTTTRRQADSTLGLAENSLKTITTTIQNIQTLLVNAGNGTMSDTDRASLATALQGQYDQLLGLANADDGNGNYLFAGLQSSTAPFTKNASGGVVYQGDTGHQLLQVDVARQMQATNNGAEIFQSVTANAGYVLQGNAGNTGNATYSAISASDPTNAAYGHSFTLNFAPDGTGRMQYSITDNSLPTPAVVVGPVNYNENEAISVGGVTFSVKGTPANGDTMTIKPAQQAGADMFANLQNVIDTLKQPLSSDSVNANLQNVLATGIRQFSNSLDNVLTVRSSVGSRMQELDALDTIGTNRDLSNEAVRSNLEDLDYASAIAEYYQRSTALQGAQQSFIQIQGMNLFKFL